MGRGFLVVAVLTGAAAIADAQNVWQGLAKNPQHTALSTVRSQTLTSIVWQTPVDLQPQYSGGDLHIHYGTPLVTGANTIIIPVKTGATGGFELQARSGVNGSVLWTQTSDYVLPPHQWTPSFGPTLTPAGRVYWAGSGGTLLYRSNVDSIGNLTPSQVNFYAAKKSKISPSVQICTPLTSDSIGTIYFGYDVNGAAPARVGADGGIARVTSAGTCKFLPLVFKKTAGKGKGGKGKQPPLVVTTNCAPAISNDGTTLYLTAHGVGSNAGFLLAFDTQSLALKSMVSLLDPQTGDTAFLSDNGSASPTVGPDGHVFIGVLEDPFRTDKGWLLQFSSDLSQSTGAPGAFGWDDTPSIVPASMVASYHGTSSYLLMTKYNNYAGIGNGDGLNKLAILDPNASQTDTRTGATVMAEVLTILGQTPDPEYDSQFPGAVYEWCINSAVVDPMSNSVLAGSEDGKLYRWDLTTNTFTESIVLTAGLGEAYTPTLIGQDGKVYAINNATLFAVGTGP